MPPWSHANSPRPAITSVGSVNTITPIGRIREGENERSVQPGDWLGDLAASCHDRSRFLGGGQQSSPEPSLSSLCRVSMQNIQFETPENVQIGYRVAGPGTRFLAWLIDMAAVIIVTLLVLVFLLFLGILASSIEGEFAELQNNPDHQPQFLMYMVGLGLILWTFSGVVYFTIAELTMRGQTWGKRLIGVRVVKQNGFSIDSTSILVRNLFRLFESLPIFWITPILSRSSQRLGDMVAGTLVVMDQVEPLPQIRRELAGRPEEKIRYRFNETQLVRLQPLEIELLERLLDRWDGLDRKHLEKLVDAAITLLSTRLQADLPPREDRLQFLEDLLASSYRRRERAVV